MIMLRLLHTGLTLAAVLAGAACPEDEVCTQSGCTSEPWIRVVDETTEGGFLRPGKYLFRLKSTYLTLDWECTIVTSDAPDPACDRSSITAMGEFDDAPVHWVVDAIHGVDGLAIAFVEVREDGQMISGPDIFTVSVIRENKVQADETHQPEYIGRWPNGMKCGPYCGYASETVIVHIVD